MSEKKTRRRRPASLPPMTAAPCLELTGNREAVLEGCKGVLEYSPACVRVNTGGMIVTFRGRELALRCISPSALIINGCINAVEFKL